MATRDSSAGGNGMVGRLYRRACLSCHQMKMRCEGSNNPPCDRCRRTGRQCLPQPSRYRAVGMHQGLQNIQALGNNATDSNPVTITTKQPDDALLGPSIGAEERHSLPSIYSTSVVETLNAVDPLPLDTPPNGRVHPNGAAEDASSLPPVASRNGMTKGILLSRQAILQMLGLFREKLLPLIPILDPDDKLFADHLVDTNILFAHCICYVTANFLPGGQEIRQTLLPEIKCMLLADTFKDMDEIQYMKILLILFAYSRFGSPSSQSTLTMGGDLLYWPLKSIVESSSLRISLHSSLRGIRVELEACPWRKGFETHCYEKYLLSLQLFLMAHYSSIVTGTPPTLRMDSSIRAAPTLGFNTNRQVDRLMGEVELYLIWEKASLQHHLIGEWWCLPDPAEAFNSDAIEPILINTNSAIDTWYRRWKEFIGRGDRNGVTLDYLGRYTRFCISSFAIRSLRATPDSLTATQTQQVRRCAVLANDVLDCVLDIGPVQMDQLRFITDSALALLSFCCLFLMATIRTFPSVLHSVDSCIDRVERFAQVMVDLTTRTDRVAYIYGCLILKRVTILRGIVTRHDPQHGDNNAGRHPLSDVRSGCSHHPDLPVEQAELQLQPDNLDVNMDYFWDFSLLVNEPGGV